MRVKQLKWYGPKNGHRKTAKKNTCKAGYLREKVKENDQEYAGRKTLIKKCKRENWKIINGMIESSGD